MEISLWPYLLCSVLLAINGNAQNKSTPARHILSRLTRDYISSEPPSFQTNEATGVKIGLYINYINEISHVDMQLSASAYIRMGWNDPRLAFNKDDYEGQPTEIRVPDSKWKSLWTPDLFIRNIVEVQRFETIREHVLMKLSDNGDIWFVVHTSFTISCPMKLQKYPFDTQICPIMFESYGYTMDSMYFKWLENPMEIDSSVQLPQYTLEDTILYDCSQNYSAGAFPCLEARFVLRRNIGDCLMRLYIPSIIFIIMSWFSFWVDIDQYSHRMLLLLLLVMLLMAQYAITSSTVAYLSYIKAIDVWAFLCLMFVFAAMLEATLVKSIGGTSPKAIKEDGNKQGDYAMLLGKVYSPSSARKIIDIVARIAFPVLFLLTIIIYFTVYTVPS